MAQLHLPAHTSWLKQERDRLLDHPAQGADTQRLSQPPGCRCRARRPRAAPQPGRQAVRLTRTGRFKLKRITDSKRMRVKLSGLKDEIERRRHLPISEQGRWLARVLRGHYNHYAVVCHER